MNSFVVLNCVYDGTSGDPNPLCQVSGTVITTEMFTQIHRARVCGLPARASDTTLRLIGA